mgnify:CR=1 FL=1
MKGLVPIALHERLQKDTRELCANLVAVQIEDMHPHLQALGP